MAASNLTAGKLLQGILFLGLLGFVPIAGWGVFRRPDLEKVPVERLLKNLERQAAQAPDDPQLQQNLARVHGMAYAQKSGEFSVEKDTPDLPWFGFVPRNVPHQQVIELDSKFAEENGLDAAGLEARRSAAREHLQRSIEHYRRAVALDSENLTVALGLAWSLDQAEQDEEAMTLYLEVIERGWQKEKELKIAGLKFQSIVREGAEYLQPHLDATADRAEIESLQQKIEVIQKIRRPVTPLAIPLGPGTRLEDTYDDTARVPFDADGSGYRRLWTWTRPQAAWLVYDPRGDGQIDSALQLFGSVSFWCFWEHGFQALEALDDDGDRVLAHDELRALALWCDSNQNGRSEPGEVRPLAAHGIVQLRCDALQTAANGEIMEYHPAGAVRLDGRSLPVYDLWLRPVDPLNLIDWPFSPRAN